MFQNAIEYIQNVNGNFGLNLTIHHEDIAFFILLAHSLENVTLRTTYSINITSNISK